MPIEVTPVGIGMIGPARSVHYVCERISLLRQFVAVAAHSISGAFHKSASDDGVMAYPSAVEVIRDPRVNLVYFASGVSEDFVASAISAGKHVVLDAPAQLSAVELRSLAQLATDNRVVAVVHQPRMWGDDFLQAWNVARSGTCGQLRRLRLSSFEHALPGEVFPQGVLRQMGYHFLDQLLVLIDDDPRSVYFRPFGQGDSDDTGFLAAIDFAHGVSAVVELHTTSLLSLRTGWLLEGERGAYRGGRYYSKTNAGEIFDEPVARPALSPDPFFDSLAAILRGEDAGPFGPLTLKHAARVQDLIAMLHEFTR